MKTSSPTIAITIWVTITILTVAFIAENERMKEYFIENTKTRNEVILVFASLLDSHNQHQRAIAENKESIKILTDMSCWPWPNETERGSVDDEFIQTPTENETVPK
jgi:hypothetical protein